MSIEKSELKVAFAHSLGCDADDDLEAAQRDALRATGRIQAARVMEAEITKVIGKLKLDMDSEEPPFSTPEAYQKGAFYLRACLAKAATLAKQSDNLRLQMEGKVMAFEHTIKRLAKIKESEEHKAAAIQAAALEKPATKNNRQRPMGTHPGPSIAEQRRVNGKKTAKKVTKKKKKKTKKQ